MKVFVAFALLIVGAADTDSLCDHEHANLEGTRDGIKSDIRFGANLIFGHCTSLDIEKTVFQGSCNKIFEEGLCFGNIVDHKYSGLELLDQPVTYGDLADGVDNVQSLGLTSCNYGRKCFNKIKRAFKKCDKEDSGFRQGVVDAVEAAYREYGEEYVEYLSGDESNTLLAEIATLLRSRYASVEDVQDSIDEFLSDEVVSDIEAAYTKLDQAAQDWCDEGCTKKSGDFLEGLFNHMDAGDGCVDAYGYCGKCADSANDFLGNVTNPIPCCLNNVIEKGITAVNYVKEKYAGQIEEIRGYISEVLSEDAFEQAKAIRDRVSNEVTCLSDSYDNHSSNDCEEA